ncbi:MAG: ABC transporter permease, partial [Myxococcota bacterium]
VWVPAFSGSAVSVAFPGAVVVTGVVYLWLERSVAGREMRWVGLSPTACGSQGVDVARRRIQAMVLSGGLAGLVCAGTVLGYKGYYELGLGAGAGFSGIAVAMVGRSGPVALVLAALAFGTLAQAGLSINAQVPKEAMSVLEAVVILLVAAAAGVTGGDGATRATPGDGAEKGDGDGAESGAAPLARTRPVPSERVP